MVYTVKTQIIGPCAMSLELPPLVRAEQLCFCCVLGPFSKVGNSRLHSTPADYLSFYGMIPVPYVGSIQVLRLLSHSQTMLSCASTGTCKTRVIPRAATRPPHVMREKK